MHLHRRDQSQTGNLHQVFPDNAGGFTGEAGSGIRGTRTISGDSLFPLFVLFKKRLAVFCRFLCENVFSAPICLDGAVFILEFILIADDRESMLIYSQNGNRMAVIITLPFITCVQSRLFSQMIERARPVRTDMKMPQMTGKGITRQRKNARNGDVR